MLYKINIIRESEDGNYSEKDGYNVTQEMFDKILELVNDGKEGE